VYLKLFEISIRVALIHPSVIQRSVIYTWLFL